MKKTRICNLLGIEYPIVQGPMVWVTSGELVAAVANAGAIGTIGPNAGARSIATDLETVGKRLRGEIAKAKSLTDKPFAVNVAIGAGSFIKFSDLYADIIIEIKVPVAIVSQGSPRIYTEKLHKGGAKVIHVIGTVEQAKKAAAAGVDAIVVSGYEGGGHSGWDALCALPLIPQVADAVKIPLLASGGIADGRGLVAALALGADGIYMGTRFIATTESPAHPEVKRALAESTDTSTVSVIHGERQLFSGSRKGQAGTSYETESVAELRPRGWRRSLRNEFTDQCLEMLDRGCSPSEFQEFLESPAPGTSTHRALTGLLQGDLVNGTIPCGQSAGLIKKVMSVKEVVTSIMQQADDILGRMEQFRGS